VTEWTIPLLADSRRNAGCADAAVLHRELRARGYHGGYSLARDYLAPFRASTVMPAPAPAVPKTRAVVCVAEVGPAGDLAAAARVAVGRAVALALRPVQDAVAAAVGDVAEFS
jgi:hypothetical protein